MVAPTIWVFEPDAAALALGSTQSPADVDDAAAAALGVEVLRRRSGGGAVLLEPGGSLWIDVVLPSEDHRWTADVSAAAVWLGEVWADAIGLVGRPGAQVHRGPMRSTPISPVVCFAGLAPGEVLGEGKVVGISQRRTRDAARFQSVAMLRWDWSMHQRLLAPGLDRVGDDVTEPSVSPLTEVSIEELLDAFLDSIDRS